MLPRCGQRHLQAELKEKGNTWNSNEMCFSAALKELQGEESEKLRGKKHGVDWRRFISSRRAQSTAAT